MKIWSYEIPLVYKDKPFIARLRGVIFNRRIEIGRYFYFLPVHVQRAAILHEIGHHRLGHFKERIKWIFSFTWIRPSLQIDLFHEQEFAADEYAAKNGCKKGMIELITIISKKSNDDHEDESITHPKHDERIERLRRLK